MRASLAALVLAAALATAGCAGPALPGSDQPGAVGDAAPLIAPPGVADRAEAVPRWEPRAASGNRSPYMVFGRTYHVRASAHGYVEEGIASWYGRKFHGRPTSSGERYDMFRFSAAHRSLPLPSWVRVTNLANGRSLVLRVNDRGPFHDERLIDLSYAAARRLGFVDQGTAPVRVEAILPEDAPPSVPRDGETLPQDATTLPGEGEIWLQAGAFDQRDAARALQEEVRALLGARADGVAVRLDAGGDALTRVRIGPWADLREASRVQALLTFADVGGVPLIVREDAARGGGCGGVRDAAGVPC